MKRELVPLLCCPDCRADLVLVDDTPTRPEVESGALACRRCAVRYPVVRGVPRFVASDAYAASFSYEWRRWTLAQLESASRKGESEEAFREQTGFTADDLRGKLVLDVGCGAGRFLKIASEWGATVIGVDLSYGVEAAQQALGARPGVSVIQADLNRLPFRPQTFDAIFSLGVLHHSGDTREAFLNLPPLLKNGGDIAVWLYYYTDRLHTLASEAWRTVFRHLPRPLTHAWSWCLVMLLSDLWATPVMSRWPWSYLRRLLPVDTHPDRQWRVLDTFEWYAARHQDTHCSPARVVEWCDASNVRDVRVLPFPTAVRGRRDDARTLPLVRWEFPDVRESRVLVYGAGEAGERMLHMLEVLAPAHVVGVVDDSPRKAGMTLGRFAISGFADVPRASYDLVVVASRQGFESIAGRLVAAGLAAGSQFVAADRVVQRYDLLAGHSSAA